MFAASVGSDNHTANKNETIINNAAASSLYPRLDWFTNATGSLFQLRKLKQICSCRLCPRLPCLYETPVCDSSTGDTEGAVRSPGNSSLVGKKGSCSGESLTFRRQACHICHTVFSRYLHISCSLNFCFITLEK